MSGLTWWDMIPSVSLLPILILVRSVVNLYRRGRLPKHALSVTAALVVMTVAQVAVSIATDSAWPPVVFVVLTAALGFGYLRWVWRVYQPVLSSGQRTRPRTVRRWRTRPGRSRSGR